MMILKEKPYRERWHFILTGAVIGVAGCTAPARGDDILTTGTPGTGDADGDAGEPEEGTSTSTTSGGGDGGIADGGETSPDPGDGEGMVCETSQCGDACCEQGEECVLGECLAACVGGVRCGDDLSVCCGEGEVCVESACVMPGAACLDSFDCDDAEFCEPTLQACLPQPGAASTCEVQPDFEDVQVTLEWSFEEEQILTIPIVADVDGDGLPEIIVSTTYHDDNGDGSESGNGEGFISGIIIVFDGTTGQEQFRIEHNPPVSYGSYGRSTIGVADVDGNGLPDIIYAGRPVANPLNRSLIHAVNGIGQHIWSSKDREGNDHHLYVRNGAPSFANFDDDPESEIVFGAAVIDNDGTVVWDQDGNGAAFGSEPSYIGGISAIADLNGDAYPEIISGRHAWSVSWQDLGLWPQVSLTQLWDAGGSDGYPAVADLDLDGAPEVALVANGTLRVLDGLTGQLWCGVDPSGQLCAQNASLRTQPIAIPSGGLGGPPTIADFDGDGRPEIAAAGARSYTVYDLYREGEDVVQPSGAPPADLGDVYVRWSRETQDQSSNSTGSSVFDFQGDGIAEVLYGDECYMRIYNGQTGDVILQIPSSSATIHEYPVVVDSDADGNSEILVVSNQASSSTHCGDIAGYTARRGLFVYGDPSHQWMRTRRVWNSHAYHVTNSDARGLTPEQETPNWTVPGLNNYRQNVQGSGVFNAPDLAVEVSVGFESCLDQEFEINVTVRNTGALGVPAGIPIALHEGENASGTLIGTKMTTAPLLPGSFEVLTWPVPAPGGQPKNFFATVDGDADVTECDEDNNSGTTITVACPVAG